MPKSAITSAMARSTYTRFNTLLIWLATSPLNSSRVSSDVFGESSSTRSIARRACGRRDAVGRVDEHVVVHVVRDVGVEGLDADGVRARRLLGAVDRDDPELLRAGLGERHVHRVADLQVVGLGLVGLHADRAGTEHGRPIPTAGRSRSCDRPWSRRPRRCSSPCRRPSVFRYRRAVTDAGLGQGVDPLRHDGLIPPMPNCVSTIQSRLHRLVDRSWPMLALADAAKTVMNATRATPIISAEAAEAVRRGLRDAFSRASVPGHPAEAGQRRRPAHGTAAGR